MGIFTSNTLSSVSGVDYTELPALEGYDATTGCAMAMLEVQQNDMALFNATIMEDFKEVAAVNEGYEVLNESASDVLNKIKEIFKKLLQKIKSIFSAFLAKLMGTFGPNEKLYTKYQKQISSYTNWDDFKVKGYRAVNNNGSGIEAISAVKYNKGKKIGYNLPSSTTKSDVTWFDNITMSDKDNIPEIDEINQALINHRLPDLKDDLDDDFGNMTKVFMDHIFADPEVKDEWRVSEILHGCVGDILNKDAGGKFKKLVEDSNNNMTKMISDIINELDKEHVKVTDVLSHNRLQKDSSTYKAYTRSKISATTSSSLDGSRKDKYTVSNVRRDDSVDKNNYKEINDLEKLETVISNMQRVATQEQKLITSFTSARLATTKFLITQARKVWSSAAAYSSREHKNEGYEFYTAVGESSAYEFTSYMEAISE